MRAGASTTSREDETSRPVIERVTRLGASAAAPAAACATAGVLGQREVVGQRLAAALPGALGALVHDQVAAEHRQAAVGAGQPHVAVPSGSTSTPVTVKSCPAPERTAWRVVGDGRERGPRRRPAVGGGRTGEGVPVRTGGGADGDPPWCRRRRWRRSTAAAAACVPASVPGHGGRAFRSVSRGGRAARRDDAAVTASPGPAPQNTSIGGQVCALQNPAAPSQRDPQACSATACRAAARARVRSPAAS